MSRTLLYTSLYLCIDTTTQGEIYLAVFDDKKKIVSKKLNVGCQYSEKLISSIDLLLQKIGKNIFKKLKGIVVVNGPGRFSALRTGVTTANTLAWSLNIPVMGIQSKDGLGDEILNIIHLNRKKKFSRPVIPTYGKELNIFKQK